MARAVRDRARTARNGRSKSHALFERFPPHAPVYLACAALYGSVIALFWPTLWFAPISLDDYGSLQEFAAAPLTRIWAHDHFGHFRPMKNLLFWSLPGAATESWVLPRAALLGLHLVVVALVQRTATRLSGTPLVGIAAAALWALHPSSATVVAWLSAANLALCLLAVLIYLELGERARSDPSSPSRVTQVAALLALTFALLSHELAVVAPLLLWFDPSGAERVSAGRAAARERAHGGLLVACSLALLLLYALLRIFLHEEAPAYRFGSEPRWALLVNAPRYLFANLWLWIWPFGRFGVLLRDQPSAHLLAAALCWVALGAALFAIFRVGNRTLRMGALWSAAFIVPVANFIPFGNTPVAVHYAYLPGVGLALAAAQLAAMLVRRVERQQTRAARIAVALSLLAVAGALWLESRKVLAAWADEEQLYLQTHEHYPDNVEVMANLSSLYLRRGDHERARAILAQARKVAPGDPIVFGNSLELLLATHQPEAALDLLARWPAADRKVDWFHGRGRALQQLRRSREAAEAFERAFALANRATEREARYRAGYQAIIELLHSQQGAKARAILAQLLSEQPEREELQLAKELLGLDSEQSRDPAR